MAKREKKDKPRPIDPDVAAANASLGLTVVDGGQPAEEARESLEELNGLPPADSRETPNVRRKTYDRKMYSRLEGEAYLEANRSMLLAMDEKDQLETSRKSVVAEWKGIIDRKEEEIQGYRHQMSNGKSELVKVEEQYDVDKQMLRVVRVSDGTVLEDWRPLEESEKQLNMADLDAQVDAVDTEAAPGGDGNDLGLELQEQETPEAAEERRASELGLGTATEDDEPQPAGDKRGLPGALPVGDDE